MPMVWIVIGKADHLDGQKPELHVTVHVSESQAHHDKQRWNGLLHEVPVTPGCAGTLHVLHEDDRAQLLRDLAGMAEAILRTDEDPLPAIADPLLSVCVLGGEGPVTVRICRPLHVQPDMENRPLLERYDLSDPPHADGLIERLYGYDGSRHHVQTLFTSVAEACLRMRDSVQRRQLLQVA